MRKEETIKLNGEEYTVTLNRESYVKIDEVCNINKCFKMLVNGMQLYEHKENIDLADDYDPYAEKINYEEWDEKLEEQEKIIERFYVRGLHILLYPKHGFKISEVEEILKPYFEDADKLEKWSEKYGELLAKCIQMKNDYDLERKNLKAQANKK